jgi:hypothetical protein
MSDDQKSLGDRWDVDSEQGLGWKLDESIVLKPLADFVKAFKDDEISFPPDASFEDVVDAAFGEGYFRKDGDRDEATKKLADAFGFGDQFA